MENENQLARDADERQELATLVGELYRKGLFTASGGNASVRSAENRERIWITPSGLFKGDLQPQAMVPLDLKGRLLDKKAGIPSSEKWMHIAILEQRADLACVIHTHAPWATLLALSETPFLPISVEAAQIGEIPRLPFLMPGTRALAHAVAAAMGEDGSAVLLQNHGLVVAAPTLRQAVTVTETIERCSELILRCLMLGKTPPTLPEKAVERLQKMKRAKG